MKQHASRWIVGALVALFADLPAACQAGGIQVGDSHEVVIEELGEPRGSIKSGSLEQLFYERGWVELRDGAVAAMKLVSQDEADARRLETDRRKAEEQAAQAERRARLEEKGIQEKQRVLADPAFLASSATERYHYWKTFRERYPDVPCDTEYAEALSRYTEKVEQTHLKQRVVELERRLADAEARAADAQRRADEAERRAYDVPAWGWSYVYYPSIYVGPRRYLPGGYFGRTHSGTGFGPAPGHQPSPRGPAGAMGHRGSDATIELKIQP